MDFILYHIQTFGYILRPFSKLILSQVLGLHNTALFYGIKYFGQVPKANAKN